MLFYLYDLPRGGYEDYKYINMVSVKLIAPKDRVSPLTATSIARLELMAAIFGLILAYALCKAFDIGMNDVTFWSDSMDVMW